MIAELVGGQCLPVATVFVSFTAQRGGHPGRAGYRRRLRPGAPR